jgi:hypothetical protein
MNVVTFSTPPGSVADKYVRVGGWISNRQIYET